MKPLLMPKCNLHKGYGIISVIIKNYFKDKETFIEHFKRQVETTYAIPLMSQILTNNTLP